MATIKVTLELAEDHAWALAEMAKRFTWEDASRLSNAFDSGRERDDMIDGVIALQRALRAAGISPR